MYYSVAGIKWNLLLTSVGRCFLSIILPQRATTTAKNRERNKTRFYYFQISRRSHLKCLFCVLFRFYFPSKWTLNMFGWSIVCRKWRSTNMTEEWMEGGKLRHHHHHHHHNARCCCHFAFNCQLTPTLAQQFTNAIQFVFVCAQMLMPMLRHVAQRFIWTETKSNFHCPRVRSELWRMNWKKGTPRHTSAKEWNELNGQTVCCRCDGLLLANHL